MFTPKKTKKGEPGRHRGKAKNIYEQIAKKYNIRKASYEELCEMARILYNYGEISGGDYTIIIFNPELAPPEFIKQRIPNYSYFLTKTDRNGKRDWIAEFEARIKYNYETGNPLGAAYREKILEKLKLLELK